MNKNSGIIFLLISLLLIVVIYFVNKNQLGFNIQPESPQNNNGQTGSTSEETITDIALNYSLSYPTDFTKLGTDERAELNTLGYIPPCTEDYNTCLYYSGERYTETNFDSAGLSAHIIEATNRESCEAFTGSYLLPNTDISTENLNGNTFSVARSGDAGAGHIAEETLYRTYHNDICLEIVTRIGYTQFANYPEGTIKEFTENNREDLMNDMKNIIRTLSLQ